MNKDFYNYNYYPESGQYYTTSSMSPSSYYTTSSMTPSSYYSSSGDRFLGGMFLAPFLLGGLAGAALARPNYWGGGYGAYPYAYPYPYPYNPYCC